MRPSRLPLVLRTSHLRDDSDGDDLTILGDMRGWAQIMIEEIEASGSYGVGCEGFILPRAHPVRSPAWDLAHNENMPVAQLHKDRHLPEEARVVFAPNHQRVQELPGDEVVRPVEQGCSTHVLHRRSDNQVVDSALAPDKGIAELGIAIWRGLWNDGIGWMFREMDPVLAQTPCRCSTYGRPRRYTATPVFHRARSHCPTSNLQRPDQAPAKSPTACSVHRCMSGLVMWPQLMWPQ